MNRYRERFEIYFHDADRTGRASLQTICRYLETAAFQHGRLSGISIDHLVPLHLTWVFSRFRIRMTEFPQCGETIFVDTWRSGVQGCFALRDYTVSDTSDHLLGAATASAALIDKTTRKPVAIPDFIREMSETGLGRAFDTPFEKPPVLTVPEHTRSFPVRIGDIDVNRHANNISYLDWIVEGLPEEILTGLSPYEAEIEYRAEAFFGQTVVSESSPLGGNGKTFLHRLVRQNDGREMSRARTVWR